jgi:hypothetical protein
VSLAASLLALTPSVAALGSDGATPRPLRPAATLPTLTVIPPGAGTHGYPYDTVPTSPSFPGAPTINLAADGYVEREFRMADVTNIYRQSGFWGSDGRWSVSVTQANIPYTTRLLGAALVRQPDNSYLRTWELPGAAHIDLHEGLYEGAAIQREEPPVKAPDCVFGVVANGATQPDNLGVYELEDAALADMQKWITQGVPPPHSPPIATSPFFNLVARDQNGNALGGIRLPDISVPTETYTAINFSQPNQQSLSPSQLLTTLQSIFTTLQTGAITDTTLRNEGLCLLEGFYTPFSNSRLQALYPTHSASVSAFTAAAAEDLAAGFLTQSDENAAVAAAKASSVP